MESQENQYRWPKAEAVYPDRPGRSYTLKRLRYRLRAFLHRGSIAQFEQFINQHPFLVTLLNEHADYSYPLVYRFLDNTQSLLNGDNSLFERNNHSHT